jgi:hypothetical protein
LPSRLRYVLLLFLLIGSASLSSVDWVKWRYGDIRVWSASKDTAYANIIVKRLHQRINAFQMELGVYPISPLYIKILPNRMEYHLLTGGKGKIVESSEAFYSPHERVIYVRSPDQITLEKYDDVLMHEYIHWFLDETLENVPLWFHEGMAVYYSGQFGFQSYYNFSRYRFLGYRLSLNDMASGYPADKSYWEMFYLTSVFAIDNLRSKHNPEWQDFWNRAGFVYNRSVSKIVEKSDFIEIFNTAYRMSLFAFSMQYDKTLGRYGWQFPLVGINAIIFSLLPFVVVAAWLKGRRKLKRMPDATPDAEEENEAAPVEALDEAASDSEEIPEEKE